MELGYEDHGGRLSVHSLGAHTCGYRILSSRAFCRNSGEEQWVGDTGGIEI
jgi:hypothetical protein